MEPAKKLSPKNNPLRVGLTGGIGSGKSVVARIFEVLGVPVFNADDVAKAILAHDPAAIAAVKEAFGEEAYAQGKPNRSYLAKVIFDDETMRTKLNGIIHPAVGEAFQRFCNRFNKAPYVLKEAAITIETGLHEQMDAVILVTAPEEMRIERVMERDGVSAEDVRRRISVQWSDDEKRRYAHFEVVNDDQSPLIPAVLKIHRSLLERSET